MPFMTGVIILLDSFKNASFNKRWMRKKNKIALSNHDENKENLFYPYRFYLLPTQDLSW